MNKIYSIILIACFIFSNANGQKIKKSDLLGMWYLSKNQVNYPTINFSEKSAILTSIGDTVYSYHYSIEGRDLVLVDMFKHKFKNPIKKIGKDTLIFERLLNNRSIQVYIKKGK